jgi:DNA polymerase-3 subunit alpha
MFVNIHSHSDFSLLDGAGTAEMRAKVARELGQNSLSLTDHGTLSGIPHHIKACENEGIKPIVGIEAYFTPDASLRGNEVRKNYHLILLAKNQEGFKNLIKLSTKAYSDGFYGKPRMDYKMLKEYSEGIMASTACISGYIPSLIQKNNQKEVGEAVERHLDIFGEDNFRFEIMPHDIPAQRLVNQSLFNLSVEYNIPVIATIDSHIPYEDWLMTQDVILMIATGQTRASRKAKKEAGEDVYGMAEDIDTLHFMSEEETINSFSKYHPDISKIAIEKAVAETATWTDGIEDIKLDKSNKMPKLNKYNESSKDIVTKKCREGIKRIGKEGDEEYESRLSFELEIMEKLEVFDYMLLVADLVEKAREKGIRISSGRGSAAGSLVSYLIGIITIDPIGHGLLFERFLNPDRKGLPDIDLDFQDNRRDEVKQIAIDEYGEDKVGNIGAFGTYLPKGSIKDVSKVLDIPFKEVNDLTKIIPGPPNTPSIHDIAKLEEFQEYFQKYPEVLEHCKRIEGQVRNLSQHAAGVIICDKPITDFMPMVRAKEEKSLVSAWSDKADYPVVSDMGFLKIDILSIDGLTKQANAIESIKEETGDIIDLDKLDVAVNPEKVDEKVMEIFQKGLTVGIWQFSASGITQFLKKVKPDRFEDLVAVNALYRPGPLEGGDANLYAERKNGKEPIEYWHPAVEPFLKETYGIMCYQEQMMQIVQELGGFSKGEADYFRKACSKLYRVSKTAARKAMADYKPKWDEGCQSHGLTKSESDDIWDRILAFGSYSFNKSHSASYALLAYQDAYLKTYYPKHFYSALLTTKATKTKDIDQIIREARMVGLRVKHPDINLSGEGFTISDDGILYGLSAVKNVGATAIQEIIANRPFENSEDMKERCVTQKVNKRVRENLIAAGAFDYCGERNKYSESEMKLLEKEVLGFSLTGKGAASEYANILDERITSTYDFEHLESGTTVVVGGEISAVKEITTRKGEPMAFVELVYGENIWNITVFASKYWSYKDLIQENSLIIARGKKDDYNEENIILNELASLPALAKQLND